MLKQKINAFWRLKIRLLIIPCLLVLLGVLFLFPNIAYPSSVDAETLIELTNGERLKQGLPALLYNETLALAAKNKADDLLNGGYFSHNTADKDFSDWVHGAGYNYSYTGENLAMDFVTNQGVFDGWMNSGKHKENILNDKYKEIGIAAVLGEFNNRKTVMVVQLFGSPIVEQEDAYLAVNGAFLLPRFLSYNTFDIFIPKTRERTFVKHNNVKRLAVLNSGHLKKYDDYNDTYWGEVDAREFDFKKVEITMLGQAGKRLKFYPSL